MNERLKELAFKAGFSLTAYDGLWEAELADIERFAELIVMECIDNLAWHGHDEAVSQLEWVKANKLRVK